MGLGLVGHVDHAYLALGVHVCKLVATGVAGGLGDSAGSRLRGRVGVASIRRSRDFVGRHRGLRAALVASAYLLLAI